MATTGLSHIYNLKRHPEILGIIVVQSQIRTISNEPFQSNINSVL